MTRWLRHPLFAPVLALAALGWGTLLVLFLAVGPALGPWATRVLTSCFGWDATTRAYRLDAVLLVTLEPPLFVMVVGVFYADELKAFLRRAGGRTLGGAAAAGFAGAALLLLSSGEVVGGVPARRPAPLRESRPAPRARLVDHRGAPFALGTPLGRPVALTFIYADCHATCPALVAGLRSAQAAAGERPLFVAVTLDPARDTPEHLAEYASRWRLDDRWHLLTGPRGEIDALLAAYGVRVERAPDGTIGHDNLVVLIDPAGRVAYTYRGLGHRPEDVAHALRGLAAEGA